MRGKGFYVMVGIGWVVGSFFAWVIVCNIFITTWIRLADERQVYVSEWAIGVYTCIAVGGMVLIPTFMAVLAMRSKLPGTGERSPEVRGFPVDASQPSEMKPSDEPGT